MSRLLLLWDGDQPCAPFPRPPGQRHGVPESPHPKARDAFEGKGPLRRPEKRLERRLEEVAKAVGGGYCRLQMPLKTALAIRET